MLYLIFLMFLNFICEPFIDEINNLVKESLAYGSLNEIFQKRFGDSFDLIEHKTKFESMLSSVVSSKMFLRCFKRLFVDCSKIRAEDLLYSSGPTSISQKPRVSSDVFYFKSEKDVDYLKFSSSDPNSPDSNRNVMSLSGFFVEGKKEIFASTLTVKCEFSKSNPLRQTSNIITLVFCF